MKKYSNLLIKKQSRNIVSLLNEKALLNFFFLFFKFFFSYRRYKNENAFDLIN